MFHPLNCAPGHIQDANYITNDIFCIVTNFHQANCQIGTLLWPESFTSLLHTLFKAIDENHKIFLWGGGGGGGGGYILAKLNSNKCGTYRNNSFLILRPGCG